MVCPCTTSGLSKPADYERCQAVLAFHVDQGAVDGVDVTGRKAVLLIDSPQNMGEGNWRVGLVLDDGASEEQATKLMQVFSGQLGGPPAMLTGLVGEMLGHEILPIEYVEKGRNHYLKVGDAIEMDVEDYVAPQFGEDGPVSMLVGVAHPVATEVTMATARKSRVDIFGLSFDNTGQNGHSAPFRWTS
jgi:hypothetical protein